GMPEERQISEYIECTGKVEVPPNSLASVYSAVNGFVGNVKYLPGDYVKKGSLLTTIKHPDIIKLQTSFLESKSRLEFSKKEFERKQTLAAEDATSEKLLQEAKLEYETELAHFQGIKAELNLFGLPTGKIETGDIQPHVQIYAPISGYIASVNINKGKLITPEDLLYEIVDDDHMHLELQIFAKDIPKVKKGQYIEAFVPGIDEKVIAEVYLVGHVIDLETKTTMVHGHFENKPATLTAGTYLHARIFNQENKTLAIPQSALIRSGDETFVYIISNGDFVRRDVITGSSDDDFIAVKKLDLLEGEKLVTKGAYYIHGSGGDLEAGHSH
ncbi:MAG: efflux RND transporter periplasmic adaptor subunit, partial [Bacteroidetes bacterium]